MQRRIGLGIIFISLVLVIAYGGGGLLVYQQAMTTGPQCQQGLRAVWADNRPDAFVTGGVFDIRETDTTPYAMPHYETVTFPSRDDQVTIAGWYAPAPDTNNAPVVILAHGLNDCRLSPGVLLPAGMLHRAGFAVLLIDLRNHGDSQITTGRMSGGILEYRDVLGAWDWLVNERGIAPERIGLYGVSLGAAAVLIAAGEEPQVAAVWEDSSYVDIMRAIEDELIRNQFPLFLGPAAVTMGRVVDGIDITARSPEAAARAMNGRPVFVAHSEADTRMPVFHARLLAEVTGTEAWIVPDSAHVQAVFDYADEYETRLVDFFRTHLAG
ncbi:MAG: hypothetical protein CL610_22965 [Anaerolineaceae bacterium]|nr:hypothetical protein [Anaerolineaceae bacterium]